MSVVDVLPAIVGVAVACVLAARIARIARAAVAALESAVRLRFEGQDVVLVGDGPHHAVVAWDALASFVAHVERQPADADLVVRSVDGRVALYVPAAAVPQLRRDLRRVLDAWERAAPAAARPGLRLVRGDR